MLVDLLDGDEAAPVYLLRLWAHCQNRKTHVFDIPQAALKALCRFPGHSNKLESSLAASGFIRRNGPSLTVLNWDEYNASLVASWENGVKGGRPKKKPRENPRDTHRLPTGTPAVTHGQPSANPGETDKIREEKNREEQPPIAPHGGKQEEVKPPPKQPPAKSELQLRAEALMRRRPETPMTPAEARAWKGSLPAIEATAPEDWQALEAFYAAPQGETFSRKDLATLLNNWNGEIERAAAWARRRRPPGQESIDWIKP